MRARLAEVEPSAPWEAGGWRYRAARFVARKLALQALYRLQREGYVAAIRASQLGMKAAGAPKS